jgi:hypothetical protein
MKQFTPDQPMRALSLKQPFASLMFNGKSLETRTWPTKYRGWVLVCSSKNAYPWNIVRDISGSTQFDRILDLTKSGMIMPEGKAIGIGRLINCREMTNEDQDNAFVRMNASWIWPKLWCHVYEDLQPIPSPFLWQGSQGWKQVSLEQKVLICHQLK